MSPAVDLQAGVEAYVGPKTVMHLLSEHDLKALSAARGYPQRMRDYMKRMKEQGS